MSDQGSAQRPDDPLRVAVPDRQGGDRVVGRHDEPDPGVEILLTDPAHHRVDETTGAGPVDQPGQPDALVDGRVGCHAHPQQLVSAEPQRVEHVLVNRRYCSAGRGGDDRVVKAPKSRCSVGELGRKGRVASPNTFVS